MTAFLKAEKLLVVLASAFTFNFLSVIVKQNLKNLTILFLFCFSVCFDLATES